MHDTVHIKIKIVELFIVRVFATVVNGNFFAINFLGLLFDDGADDLRILLREPSKERRNTHDGRSGYSRLECNCSVCVCERAQRSNKPWKRERGCRVTGVKSLFPRVPRSTVFTSRVECRVSDSAVSPERLEERVLVVVIVRACEPCLACIIAGVEVSPVSWHAAKTAPRSLDGICDVTDNTQQQWLYMPPPLPADIVPKLFPLRCHDEQVSLSCPVYKSVRHAILFH